MLFNLNFNLFLLTIWIIRIEKNGLTFLNIFFIFIFFFINFYIYSIFVIRIIIHIWLIIILLFLWFLIKSWRNLIASTLFNIFVRWWRSWIFITLFFIWNLISWALTNASTSTFFSSWTLNLFFNILIVALIFIRLNHFKIFTDYLIIILVIIFFIE